MLEALSIIIIVSLLAQSILSISIKRDNIKRMQLTMSKGELSNVINECHNKKPFFKLLSSEDEIAKIYHESKIKEFIEYNIMRATYFKLSDPNEELKCGVDIAMTCESSYIEWLLDKYNINTDLISELSTSVEIAEREYHNLKIKSDRFNGKRLANIDYYNEPIVKIKVGGLI